MTRRDDAPRLIITRPEPDGKAFAEAARAAGFEPVFAPVMTIVLQSAAPALNGVAALAFTSANGARAFAAVSDERGLPVFAVGGMTAKEAERLGFSDLHLAGGDVESLANVIAATHASGRFKGKVLHVAGAARAGDLVAALAGAGVPAELAVLYEALPSAALTEDAARALADPRPGDAVALFSPRSAKLFIELARKARLEDRLKDIAAACLSAAVADAAKAVCWGRIIVAAERTGESLLSTLLREIDGSRG